MFKSTKRLLAITIATAAAVSISASAAVAADPVAPVELDRAESIAQVGSWAAPDGDQAISYRRQDGGAVVGLRLKEAGQDFGPWDEIAPGNNATGLEVAFAPDGGAYAVTGYGVVGAQAIAAIRNADSDRFGAGHTVSSCGRYSSVDYSVPGELGLACSTPASGSPPDRFGFGIREGIGFVTPTNFPIGKVYDSFIRPRLGFGPDGTMAVVATHLKINALPPPPNPTEALRVSVRNAETTALVSTELDSVNSPADIRDVGLVVLPGGEVNVLAEEDAPGPGSTARIYSSTAPWTTWTQTNPGSDYILGNGSDEAGNLHMLVGDSPGTMAPPVNVGVIVKPAGGSPAAPVPVNLGTEDFPDDFLVAPDGTEYLVIHSSSDGSREVRIRAPGAAAFGDPLPLVSGTAPSFSSVLTSDGDLLAAWAENVGPGEMKLMAGGLDSGSPPEITDFEVPGRTLVGTAAHFHAAASDSMGIGSWEWEFGDGGSSSDPSPRHTYRRPGRYTVRLTVADRAGNRSSRTATVIAQRGVPVPPRLTVRTPKRLRFQALRRKGLRVRVRADVPVRVRATLRLRRGKRLIRLAARNVKAPAIRRNLRLKPNRKRLGKRRSLRLRLRVVATTSEGARRTVVRNLRIRR